MSRSRPKPGPRAASRATPKAGPVHAPWSPRTFAVVALGGFAAIMAFVLLVAHRIPLYGVETDLFGEFIPAVRALLAGRPTADHYAFKGPGYPLLLALSTLATFGDAWLAARLLNLVAAVAAAGVTFLLVRRTVGDAAALFVLVALCANPLYIRATIEAGTDVPTFALCIGATYLALTARGPRGAAGAGFLAGLAILCRYNAAFLVPAGLVALLVSRERTAGRAPTAGAYLLGLLLPVAPWLVLNQRISGSAFGNSNYANLAFELYGRGMPWDRFWAEVAPRFRSYTDVLRYDPASALGHWGRNLGTRWLEDLRQLVPAWIGSAAVIGVLVHARRAAGGAGLLVHYALCYATLALVFYAARFFLYLVPFYLVGAALALFPLGRGPSRPAAWRIALAGVLVLGSAAVAQRDTALLLRDAPSEILAAGKVLRAIAQPGDRLLARKPQVAYFAAMTYVPFPQVESLAELLAAARWSGARYMNVSGIEASLRPQFRMLELDVRLPGFTLLHREVSNPDRFYFLYRIEPAGPADSAFADSMRAGMRGLAARYPNNPQIHVHAGVLLFEEGRIAEALTYLDRAVALDPTVEQTRGYRAVVLFEAGRLDEAARDCQQVISTLARPPASYHILLGCIRVRQQRLAESQAAFEAAVRVEPASVTGQVLLGLAMLAQGNVEGGRSAIDRAVRIEPGVASLREDALGRAARGDVAGLVRLIARTYKAVSTAVPAGALVDSARAVPGPR